MGPEALVLLVLALIVVGFIAGAAVGSRLGADPPTWLFVASLPVYFLLLAIALSNYEDDSPDAGGTAFALPLALSFALPALVAVLAGMRHGARRRGGGG